MQTRRSRKHLDSKKRRIPILKNDSESTQLSGEKKDDNRGEEKMRTQNFRTKSMFLEVENPSVEDVWGIAIDIGYSGTKLYSPNMVACFPSFASQIKGSLINANSNDPYSILYRDGETGRMWKVGKAAQDVISNQDPDQMSSAIYGRQRYFSPMYMVIARTALGICCMNNKYGGPGNKRVFLETGLPNAYLRSDKPLIIEALAGMHIFDLKIGTGEWMHFEINLDADDIFVIPQPLGTLTSVSTDNNGIPTPESEDYSSTSVAICDPGFGTMDCFSLRGGEMRGVETSTDFTMQKILSETSDKIFRKYHVEIPVPAMQKCLEQGYFTQFNRQTRSGDNIEFADILEACNKNIAMQMIDKICELYDNLLDYSYLVLTGGTGEAWYPYFVEAFKGMPNLQIIPGNKNTEGMIVGKNGERLPLPFIFANVRGYYIHLLHILANKAA